jgi:hypothetical protein
MCPFIEFHCHIDGLPTPKSLKKIAELCPDLSEINFHGFLDLEDRHVYALFANSLNIHSIYIQGTDIKIPETFELLTQQYQQTVNIRNFCTSGLIFDYDEDEIIKFVTTRGQELIKLQLSNCEEQITDNLLETIADYCVNLTCLDVSDNYSVEFSDDAVQEILYSCTKLKHLKVTDCQISSEECFDIYDPYFVFEDDDYTWD